MKKLSLALALAITQTNSPIDQQTAATFATAAATIVGAGLATSYSKYAYDDYARSEATEERSFTELGPLHSHLTTACKFDTQMRPLSKVALESFVRSAGLLGIGCLLRSLGNNNRPLKTEAVILMGALSLFVSYWFTQTTKLSSNGETLKKINNLERRINDLKVEIMHFANVIATNKPTATTATTIALDSSNNMNQTGALSNYNIDAVVAQQAQLIAEMKQLEEELAVLKAIEIAPVA